MKHSTRRILALGAAGVVAAITLSACSTSSTPSSSSSAGLTHVTLQLQWVPQAQFAGYYAAVAQGFYEKEGLDVTIKEAGTDTVPIDVLASGDADFAISWVPKVLGSIEKGTNVTDIAQIFERSGTTQISFKDKGITTPADLKGKKVGVQQGTTGEEYAKSKGLETIQYENTGLLIQAIKTGGVDAAINNQSVLGFAAKGDSSLVFAETYKTGEKLGVAVKKDNKAMTDSVNKTLKRLADDGTMTKLKTTWFGEAAK